MFPVFSEILLALVLPWSSKFGSLLMSQKKWHLKFKKGKGHIFTVKMISENLILIKSNFPIGVAPRGKMRGEHIYGKNPNL